MSRPSSRVHQLARLRRPALLARLEGLTPEWAPIQRAAAVNYWSRDKIIDQIRTLELEQPADEAPAEAAPGKGGK